MTKDVRAKFDKVFELLQRSEGSVKHVSHFAYWAAANPTEFYTLYARLLPKAVDVTSGGEGLQRAVLVMPPEQIPEGEYVVVDNPRLAPVEDGEVVGLIGSDEEDDPDETPDYQLEKMRLLKPVPKQEQPKDPNG